MSIIGLYIILFAFILLSVIQAKTAARANKEIDDKVKTIDMQTKRRVLAMHAAGVPHKEIAQKISYLTGKDSKKAEKLVEGIKQEDKMNKMSSQTSSQSIPKKTSSNTTPRRNANSNVNKKTNSFTNKNSNVNKNAGKKFAGRR